MSSVHRVFVIGVVVLSAFAWSQPPAPPPPAFPPAIPGAGLTPPALPPPGLPAPQAQPSAGPADPAAAPPPVPVLPKPLKLPKGDVVTLKNGKVLRQVQVVKTSLSEVHVLTLVVPGADLEPLIIPRQYVESIEYDDYDPNAALIPPATVAQSSELVTGVEVSKDLGEKLHVKLSPTLLYFQNRDMIEVLEALSREVGVSIEVSRGVRALPTQQRLWTLQLLDETTLFTLLHQKLPEKFPDFIVDYQFDKVVVATRSEKEPAPLEPAGAPEVASSTGP